MKHLLLSIALLLLSPPALAGGGTMASQSVNLLLLITALVLVARKPVSNIFKQRATKIKAQLEKGQKMLDAAKAREAEIDVKLAALETQKSEIIAQAQAEAQLLKEDFKQQIEAERLRIEESTKRSIEDVTNKAKAELQREAAILAFDLARETITASITEDDHKTLSQNFISAVASSH